VYEPESYATSDVVLVATNTNTKHLRRVAEEEKEEAAIPKCKRSQVFADAQWSARRRRRRRRIKKTSDKQQCYITSEASEEN
jgi:hypothetical protein